MPDEPGIDLVFIDADKPRCGDYSPWCPGSAAGGVLLADNVLWSGEIADGSVIDSNIAALRAFNDKVAVDDRVEVVVLPAFDGLAIARKV